MEANGMKLRRLISMALATTAVGVCAATFASCETARPEVEITITFEGETYECHHADVRFL